MSVDLRSNTLFSRASLLLMDDCLIKLEHGRTKDRVRRYSFDRIESVVIYRQIPWVRLIICAVVLLLPGFLLLLAGETSETVTGIVLMACAVFLIVWYLYCRKTTIRVVRAGQQYEVAGIFRPGRFRRFRDRLIGGINAVQLPFAPPIPPVATLEPPPLPVEPPPMPVESIANPTQA